MATATVRVSAVEIDPLRRDRLRRWLVTADVLAVHEGDLPGPVLTMLVHSPSRDFRDPEPLGGRYRVTLGDQPDQPYMGPFTAERLSDSTATGPG